MSRLEIRIALLFAAAVPLMAAYMGGWAVISVQNLPNSIVAGQPTNLTFSVRQHGEDLLTGLKPTVTGVSGKNEFTGRAVETNKAGYYTVTLNPAQTGEWTFTIRSGFNNDAKEGRLKLLPIERCIDAVAHHLRAEGEVAHQQVALLAQPIARFPVVHGCLRRTP